MRDKNRIRALETAAANAGDWAQVLICRIALGVVTLDEDCTIASLGIAAHLSPRERRDIGAMDRDDCVEACIVAIEVAAGERDPRY